MRTVEEPLVVAATPERPNPPINRQQKRSANRRSRNESGKSSNGQLANQNNNVASKINPSPVFISKPTPPTDEWVKASKKTKPSRRRSTTLSVCSTVIARVIGRGGANINAIREATGASIEVEKQSAVRRDQHDRQICIRGTQETVRGFDSRSHFVLLFGEVQSCYYRNDNNRTSFTFDPVSDFDNAEMNESTNTVLKALAVLSCLLLIVLSRLNLGSWLSSIMGVNPIIKSIDPIVRDIRVVYSLILRLIQS
ncbi:KH domain protein [Teladorsagia circumcincta]|uniref:KH domain protein n=1 Tax=Teladorsagia circumcincta TaxID=45464 RepID=A0A2G9UXJ5_TELCI|nr:KH domain protein [Teladorsagia circumcincta]